MAGLKFSYRYSLVPDSDVAMIARDLAPEIRSMREALKSKYDDPRASINLVDDKKQVRLVKDLARKFDSVDSIFVVGIGGSNLGTLAVHEAVQGKLHNFDALPQVFFADTVDPSTMSKLSSILDSKLKAGKKVLLNLISKSGSTTESIANFEVLLGVLKRRVPVFNRWVVITTDEGSPLWELAEEENFFKLPIPEKVGGRFSVLSPVGLFPLQVMGVDISKLLVGAKSMRDQCLKPFKQNPAALSAILHYFHSKNDNIANTFLFSNDLEGLGKWYRQLMGESIGKEWNKEHSKKVFAGLTPTVAVGSTDLHSMAQLYLGGPNDKFTTFVTLESESPIKVPRMSEYELLVSHIQGKPLSDIMGAILNGVLKAFEKGERPFCLVTLPDKSPISIGQFLQFKMMEMMYLGYLLNVNPFDQPNVESYKKETRRLLSR